LVVEVKIMLSEETGDTGIGVSGRTLALLLFGISLIAIGIAVIVLVSIYLGRSVSAGGIILIGPIPIVFGAGQDTWLLVSFGIIITIISSILFWIFNKKLKRDSD
jgi:uncharacterized membrane protein